MKSNDPSRPAFVPLLGNITSLPGPYGARHSCMRRCNVAQQRGGPYSSP